MWPVGHDWPAKAPNSGPTPVSVGFKVVVLLPVDSIKTNPYAPEKQQVVFNKL